MINYYKKVSTAEHIRKLINLSPCDEAIGIDSYDAARPQPTHETDAKKDVQQKTIFAVLEP